ncbi:GTP pyrophosphokinase [Roseivirga pacifica]|uniref:GTP pyrophosphokinase n=1 Tax=Roseivirga pacifica TaxID=1267423 RepID=UPI003BACD347
MSLAKHWQQAKRDMATTDINIEIDRFYKYYGDYYKTLETGADYFKSLITSILLDEVAIQGVTSRVKHRDECVSKFRRKYQKSLEENSSNYEIKDHITDLIGIRVICLYITDIEKVKKILSQNFEVVDVTDKIQDLEKTENQFGYKSLHLDLKLDAKRKKLPENKQYVDLQFEVQIRTIIQDAWSVLDHKIKYKKNIPADLKRRINRLAALFELADDEFNNIRVDTEDFEEKATEIAKEPNQPINIISFLNIAVPAFPNYQFIHYKVDSFIHEILEIDDTFTKEDLSNSISNHLDTVKHFNSDVVFQTPAHYLNPFTMLRHCLYLSEKEKFGGMLFDIQKFSFEKWLIERSEKPAANNS